jgi:hypothetical protein
MPTNKSNKLSINKDIEKISAVSGKDGSAIVSQPLVIKNILKNSDKTSADSLITENLYNILMNPSIIDSCYEKTPYF